MRGAPSQWSIGSQWLGDGGVYPGRGESIGLAGTSPERADGGLWNDGGSVGDPPFDPMSAEYYDSAIGAGQDGGPGGYVVAGGGGGGSGGGDYASHNDFLNGHILAGAISAGLLAVGVFAWHHHVTEGQSDHKPIRWTIGEIGLVVLAGLAGQPIAKAGITWLGSRIPPLSPLADYVDQ